MVLKKMGRSVLIIDDEPLICMGILELINWKQYGFDKTDVCFNFSDGIKAALRYPYSLIITDILIHDDSGLDIARAVREAKMPTKIILISAYAEFDYARDGIKYGVENYLLKPLRKDELEKALAHLEWETTEEDIHSEPNEEKRKTDCLRMPQDKETLKCKGTVDIDGIIKYIHENYANPKISLTWFANNAYVNPSYLGQRFRQRTGLKFTDYLNQYRIVKACELLLEDQYLTYEISEKVGFGNATYFYRVFKKVTGYGTEEFKKKIGSGSIILPTMQKIKP